MNEVSNFSHIGITVSNIDKAVNFYSDVFGWEVIKEPQKSVEDNTTIRLNDVFGKGWESFQVAHLLTPDGIGIEIFEFSEESKENEEFDYARLGVFHFCIQNPDPEKLLKKIVEYGGKQRMPIRKHYPDEKSYRMVFCEDPFGNVFEIYSHSYELINAGKS